MRHFLLIILFCSLNSWSQELSFNETISKFAEEELIKWNVPGAAIAVVKDGQIIYSEGFGFRDMINQLPVNENTLFAIGSLTKSITATTAGILVDRKRLNWNTKVVNVLPDFKLKDEFASQRINMIDLLCHRSGLPNHNLMWYVTDFSRDEIIHRLRYLEPSEDFRTTFQYNPNMYTLAGYVVGKVSGLSWEEFTTKNILEPLKMSRTNFTWMDMVQDQNFAKPYIEKDGKVIETEFHKSQHISAPAGSINSSVNEFANWLIMNLNKGVFEDKRIVSEASLNYIQSPHITFPSTNSDIGVGPEGEVYSYSMYGLGWMIGTYHDQIILEHAGGIDGFSSKMTLLPRLNAGIVVLTNNQMGGDLFCTTLSNRIITTLMDAEPFDYSDWLSKQGLGLKQAKEPEKKAETSKKYIRSTEQYIGAYEDPGYGTIVIATKENRLNFKYYRYQVNLEFIDNDSFKTIAGIINRKVEFKTNESGDIDRLEIQWDRSVKPIVFYKK